MVVKLPILKVGDTIGDAFDHLETHGAAEIAVIDRNQSYVVSEAELRRYIAQHGRQAMYTQLGELVGGVQSAA
jgi:hypothetical protein